MWERLECSKGENAKQGEFLAKKVKQVVLVEMLGEIAADSIGDNRKFLISKLNRLQVEIRKTPLQKKLRRRVFSAPSEPMMNLFTGRLSSWHWELNQTELFYNL